MIWILGTLLVLLIISILGFVAVLFIIAGGSRTQ